MGKIKIDAEAPQINKKSTNNQVVSADKTDIKIKGKPVTVRSDNKADPARQMVEAGPEQQPQTAATPRQSIDGPVQEQHKIPGARIRVDEAAPPGKMDNTINIHFLDTKDATDPFKQDMTHYKRSQYSVDAMGFRDSVSVDPEFVKTKKPFASQLIMVDTMKYPGKTQIVAGAKREQNVSTVSVDNPTQKLGVDKALEPSSFNVSQTPVQEDRLFLNDSFRMIQSGDLKGGVKTAISDLSSKAVAGLKTARAAAKKEMVKVAVIILGPLLLVVLALISIVGMTGSAIIAPVSIFGLTAYPSDEKDITDSTFDATNYCEDLKEEIKSIPSQPEWSHINEFRYIPSLDAILNEIDYDPWELQAYLNAKFEKYNAADVASEIQSIFGEMFDVVLREIVEIRYRTNSDGEEESYEYYILEISLNKTELETVTGARMDGDQKEIYDIYMNDDLRGTHQGVSNPFDIDWRPYVSCRYGWRENPTSPQSGGEWHTGLDIALPHGTPVYSGVTGYVTNITTTGAYGNRVEVTSLDGKVRVFYAHMSAISVTMGQPVISGVTEVGKVGSTGRSTGSHLHIETSKNGETIDPIYVVGYGKRGMV